MFKKSKLEWKAYRRGEEGPDKIGFYIRYINGYPPQCVRITDVREFEGKDGKVVKHSFCDTALPPFIDENSVIFYYGVIELPIENHPSNYGG